MFERILLPQAAPGVHESVIAFMRSRPPGRVLDIPAGAGHLSAGLRDLGWVVVPADIRPEVFSAKGLTCVAADLQVRLPFDDGSFDAIACVEGIEHVENPHHVVREFFRILKPGGILALTTPNIHNIRSRVKYALFGVPCYFNARIDIDDPSLKGHINPLGLPELELILQRNHFAILSVWTNGKVSGMGITLAAAFLKMVNRSFNKAYNPLLVQREVIGGEILVVMAQKELS